MTNRSHTVINAAVLDGLKTLPDHCADMVVLTPPAVKTITDCLAGPGDEKAAAAVEALKAEIGYPDMHTETGREIKRILKAGGNMIIPGTMGFKQAARMIDKHMPDPGTIVQIYTDAGAWIGSAALRAGNKLICIEPEAELADYIDKYLNEVDGERQKREGKESESKQQTDCCV